MKVKFRECPGGWYWELNSAISFRCYSRRRDAVRGFNRFINQTRNVMIGRM